MLGPYIIEYIVTADKLVGFTSELCSRKKCTFFQFIQISNDFYASRILCFKIIGLKVATDFSVATTSVRKLNQ